MRTWVCESVCVAYTIVFLDFLDDFLEDFRPLVVLGNFHLQINKNKLFYRNKYLAVERSFAHGGGRIVPVVKALCVRV